MWRLPVILLFALLCDPALGGDRDDVDTSQLRQFDTRYYVMHTDLDIDAAREASVRMTRMFEIYRDRTREFGGEIKRRMPFYLFRHQGDYYKAGGLPDSSGVFDSGQQRLMAVAGESVTDATWHVVQHEGFHQFIFATIGTNVPIWANEGLAEYFGEALFTGDNYVTGVIPQWRLERIREHFKAGTFKSAKDLLQLSHAQWNQEINPTNYDQAWSIVQFFAHGEQGRYQQAFIGYMRSVAGGRSHARAWQQNFGGIEGFEKQWRAYWETVPDHSTADLYAQAATEIFTSFLARAVARKLPVQTLEDLATLIDRGQLKLTEKDWLPLDLFSKTWSQGKAAGSWAIDARKPGPPRVIGLLASGKLAVGRMELKGSGIRVWSEIDHTPKAILDAKEMIADGRRDSAREVLRAAIKAQPDSMMVEEARKLLLETKQPLPKP